MIELQVNGEARSLPDGTTIAELLAEMGLATEGVAVAVDRQVIPRSKHAETRLEAGAQVEVLRAVGGG